MLSLDKSRYIDEISSQKSLTCIIAAKGIDGCVIISDTRVMRDFEASNESKIYNMWEKLPLVITGSGTAALLDKFKMRIFNLKFSNATDRPKAEILVENVVAQLYGQYARRLKDD